MTINLPIELPDDFTFGNCTECPLSYEEYDCSGYIANCIFGRPYDECPLREADTYGADAQ